MSIEAIELEIAKLDDAQIRRLIAYAVVLQDRKSGRFPSDFTAKLDAPERWVSLDELDQRLGFRPEELAE